MQYSILYLIGFCQTIFIFMLWWFLILEKSANEEDVLRMTDVKPLLFHCTVDKVRITLLYIIWIHTLYHFWSSRKRKMRMFCAWMTWNHCTVVEKQNKGVTKPISDWKILISENKFCHPFRLLCAANSLHSGQSMGHFAMEHYEWSYTASQEKESSLLHSTVLTEFSKP